MSTNDVILNVKPIRLLDVDNYIATQYSVVITFDSSHIADDVGVEIGCNVGVSSIYCVYVY